MGSISEWQGAQAVPWRWASSKARPLLGACPSLSGSGGTSGGGGGGGAQSRRGRTQGPRAPREGRVGGEGGGQHGGWGDPPGPPFSVQGHPGERLRSRAHAVVLG